MMGDRTELALGRSMKRTGPASALLVADQVLYSLSNFALLWILAASASGSSFGQIATALLIVNSANLVVRSCVSEAAASTIGATTRSTVENGAIATGCILGLGAASTIGLYALRLEAAATIAAIASALLLPVVAQDLLRYESIRQSRPLIALSGDAIWLATSAGLWVLLWQNMTTTEAVGSWLFGATISGALVGVLISRRSDLRSVDGASVAKRRAKAQRQFFLEGASVSIAEQGAWLTVASIVGPVAFGGARLLGSLFGPLSLVAYSIGSLFVAGLTKQRELSTRHHESTLGYIFVFLVCASVAWGGIAGLVIHSSVTDRWPPETTETVRDLWLPTVAGLLPAAALTTLRLKLKSTDRIEILARTRVRLLPLTIAGLVGSAAAFGLVGAQWFASANAAVMVLLLIVGTSND